MTGRGGWRVRLDRVRISPYSGRLTGIQTFGPVDSRMIVFCTRFIRSCVSCGFVTTSKWDGFSFLYYSYISGQLVMSSYISGQLVILSRDRASTGTLSAPLTLFRANMKNYPLLQSTNVYLNKVRILLPASKLLFCHSRKSIKMWNMHKFKRKKTYRRRGHRIAAQSSGSSCTGRVPRCPLANGPNPWKQNWL